MTAITQKIPNFIGGISQQPNELQPLGTLKDALNVIPDVKGVVAKRPGTQFMGALTNISEGKWYHYFRDEQEEYIIRIRRNGIVDVWNTDGKPMAVSFVSEPINAIDEIVQGLPTPGSATEGAQSQFENCDLASFTTTLNDVKEAEAALVAKKEEIEELNVQRSNLQIEVEGTFTFDLEYRTLKAGIARDGAGELILQTGKPDEEGGYIITGLDPVEDKTYVRTADIIVGGKEYVDARLYGWKKVRITASDELEAVETAIDTANDEIPALLTTLNTAREAWEPVAAECGVYENPFGRANNVFGAPRAVPYFEHTEDEDLQLITVNDYTFVVNRNKIPTMVASGDDKYNFNKESFVTLDLLSVEKPYTLFFDLIDKDTTTDFVRASKIRISPSSWEDGSDTCAKNGSETFTHVDPNDSSKTMQVRVTTIGSQYLVGPDPDTGGTNYDCRHQTQVQLLSSGPGWNVGDSFGVSMKGQGYTITVEAVSTQSVSADITVSSTPIASDGVLDSVFILNSLKDKIEAQAELSDFTVRVVGNGLFIQDTSGNKPFKITTPDVGYMTCINGEVNNVSDLPDQCVDGYTVRVKNSFAEEDDYWVKFDTEIKTTDNTGDDFAAGAGTWEETVDPTVDTDIDFVSMPYQIRRLPNQTFEISPIRWGSRTVGDDITNPIPSFIGKPINKMVFFRNRLAMLAGESIVFSRPNEYFNYWANTALVVSDGDPIDLNVSSTFPAILYDAIDSAAGLMLFSENQQHLVVTDNTDLFSPETAVVKSVGTYKYNSKTKPIDMGQTVGFLNDAGYRSRYFEIIPSRDDRYQAVEISKPVDQLIPSGINLTASSKDNNLIAFAVKDSDEVFVYRYYTDGQERKQSAWFRWKVNGKLKYHFVIGDSYYVVTENVASATETIINLQKMNLVIDKGQALINLSDSMRDYEYQIHLDGYFMVIPSEMSYNSDANTTSFRLPIGYHGQGKAVAYEVNLDSHNGQRYVQSGRTGEVTLTGTVDNVIGTINGDWTRNNIVTGFPFEMQMVLPTMYVSQTAGTGYTVKDTRSYLTIHRVELNFENLGEILVTVTRRGRDPYTMKFYATPADFYTAGTTAIELNQSRIVPIYDKNENVEIAIHADSPEPVTIVSASWEGDYNDRNYKRV